MERDQTQQVTECNGEIERLNVRLEQHKASEVRHEKKQKSQKSEIEFLEEIQYQLQGDVRELKDALKDKEARLQTSEIALKQSQQLLLGREAECACHTRACEVLKTCRVEPSDDREDVCKVIQQNHRTRDFEVSLDSAIETTPINSSFLITVQRDSIRLSPRSVNSRESLRTINSVATSGLANDGVGWDAEEHQDEEDARSSPFNRICGSTTLGDELDRVSATATSHIRSDAVLEVNKEIFRATEQTLPNIRLRAATIASEPVAPIDVAADIVSKSVATQTECSGAVPLDVTTSPGQVVVAQSNIWVEQAVCTQDLAGLKRSHAHELWQVRSEFEKNIADLTRHIRRLEGSCETPSPAKAFELWSGAPRTSHLFEVKNFEGKTEMKFSRVPGSPGYTASSSATTSPGQSTVGTSLTGPLDQAGLCSSNSHTVDLGSLLVKLAKTSQSNPALQAQRHSGHSARSPRRLRQFASASQLPVPIPIPVRRESLSKEFSELFKPLDVRLNFVESTLMNPAGLALPDAGDYKVDAPHKRPNMPNFSSSLTDFSGEMARPITSSKSAEPLARREPDHKPMHEATIRPHTSASGYHEQLPIDSQVTQAPKRKIDMSAIPETSHDGAADAFAQKLTKTLIGVEMFKYIRQTRTIWSNSRSKDELVARHKRYVMLRPNEGTICWSSSRPAGKVLGFKRCYINEVHDIEDNSPTAADMTIHNRSLLVISNGQSLKFTAHDEETHDVWFEVISQLLRERKQALTTTPIYATVRHSPPVVHYRTRESRATSANFRLTARPGPITRSRPPMPELSIKGVQANALLQLDAPHSEHQAKASAESANILKSALSMQTIGSIEKLKNTLGLKSHASSPTLRGTEPPVTNKRNRREVSMTGDRGEERTLAAFFA